MALPHTLILPAMKGNIGEVITLLSAYTTTGINAGGRFSYGLIFAQNGQLTLLNNSAPEAQSPWISSAPNPTGDYWIRFSGISGGADYTGSTLNTWLEMNVQRSVTVNKGPAVFYAATATIEIAGGPAGVPLLATATLDFVVESGA